MKTLLAVSVASLCGVPFAWTGSAPSPDRASADMTMTVRRADFLRALRVVECGDVAKPKDGDKGRAIGPYQIRMLYFVDSMRRGSFQQCRDRAFAERVVDAYMDRFAPGRLKDRMSLADCEVVARTHNGGPDGAREPATEGYWKKVREALR